MLPYIEIGGVEVGTYGLLYALGMGVGAAFCYARLVRAGMDAGRAGWAVLLILWGGAAGAFLLPGLVGGIIDLVAGRGWSWKGGNAYVIGLGVGTAVAIGLFRRGEIGIGRSLDAMAPGLALGQSVARWGCALRGCCYGQLTDSWLGFVLPDVQGAWLRRYPTQLMSVAANGAIMVALLVLERRAGRDRDDARAPGRAFPGYLFATYLALYATKRLLIDFIRADRAPAVGPLSLMQLIVLALLMVDVGVAWVLVRRRQRSASCQRAKPVDTDQDIRGGG